MNTEKNEFVLINLNTYHPTTNENLASKIKISADDVKKKYPNYENIMGIVINEAVAGKDGKYIEALETAFENKFTAIPANIDYIKHKKTLLTVILIKNEINYEIIPLKWVLPNRVVAVKLDIPGKNKPLILLGVYNVQTQVFPKKAAATYIMKRYLQKEEMWSEIINFIKTYNNPCLIIGDLQEPSIGLHMEILKSKYNFYEKNPGFPSVINPEFLESNIDHAMMNTQNDYRLIATGIDTGLIGTVSDHAMLTASIV